jgi:hypothetical protein
MTIYIIYMMYIFVFLLRVNKKGVCIMCIECIVWDMWYSMLIGNECSFNDWERIVGDCLTKYGYLDLIEVNCI